MSITYNNDLRIVTLPGLWGSGPDHWQTRWERLYGFERVEQLDWGTPDFEAWFQNLSVTIGNETGPKNIVIVAHSLGCHFAIKSYPYFKDRIAGLFLVAPPDLNCGVIKVDVSSFKSGNMERLDTPGYLVYSENDPYAEAQWSSDFGRQLGFVTKSVGSVGHINSESHLGNWDDGLLILNGLVRQLHPIKITGITKNLDFSKDYTYIY